MSFKSFTRTSLATILLASATILNAQELHWRIPFVDVFSQPNDTNLIWYGSGDVDSNNVLNLNDYNAMDSISNDMSDIDGDGTPSTQNDKDILSQYLNNNLNFLPSNFVRSDSTQKRDWLTKMLAIDKTNAIPYQQGFTCGNFANRLHYQFHGGDPNEFKDSTNSTDIWDGFKLNYVGRFNIPIYEGRLRGPPGHSIDGIYIGQDDPTEYHYLLIEPQRDKIFGKFTEDTYFGYSFLNNNITFYDTYYNYNDNETYSHAFISFYIDSVGNATMTYKKPWLVMHNPNKDSRPPELVINSPKQDSIYNNFNIFLDYYAKDSIFINSANFNLNNSRTDIDCSTPIGWCYTYCDSIQGEILLNPREGENQLIFNVDDIAKPNKNLTTKTIDFIIDTKPPETNFSIKNNETYDSTKIDFDLSDPNLELDSCWYKINNSKEFYTSNSGTINSLDIQEGENNFISYVKDKAGNLTKDTINFIINQNGNNINKNLTSKYSLEQNFPNPFNNSTSIKYTITKPGKVSLKVYDIKGKELETIINEYQTPNTYIKNLNTTNYSSGIYFYRLTTPEKTKTKKMIKIK